MKLGVSASSCSSSMSPTIDSTTSSIETRPSVPPYSSMTSAIWVRDACILSRRSSAGIDGGAYRTGLRMRASEQRHVEPCRPIAAGSARLAGLRQPEARIGGEEDDEVADVDHAARIVERLVVDRQARMAGGAKAGSSTSRKGVSSASAMMSARGTITSATRTSCSAEHILEDGALLRRELRRSRSRRSRPRCRRATEAGARPNSARRRSNRPEGCSRGRDAGRRSGTRLVVVRFAHPSTTASA